MEDTHTHSYSHSYFNTRNKTILVLRLSKEDLEDMIDINSDDGLNAEKVIGMMYGLVRMNVDDMEMLVYVDGDVEVDNMGEVDVDGSVRVFRDKEEMYFVLAWLHKNGNQMVYVEDEGNLPSENILKFLEVDEDSK